MEKMIMIPTGHLIPHPDNPRRNIGDVSELQASIEVSGILQNLTVVPAEIPGMFKVIIGHRRLAAAKAAGLEEVPCAVVEMSEEDQLATMLVENMQRSDLTVLEEADGFQMMLDLGKTVNELSRMSGVSETKIRNRVKLTKMDREATKAALDRGATLYDLAEIESLEEEEAKERVLKVAGTADFKNQIKKELGEQTSRKLMANAKEQLKEWAAEIYDPRWCGSRYMAEIKDTGEQVEVEYRSYFTPPNMDTRRPDDADQKRYFFTVNRYSSGLSLYAERAETDRAEQAERQRRLQAEREKEERTEDELELMTLRHEKLREDFAKSFNQFTQMRPWVQQFIAKAFIASAKEKGYFGGNSEASLTQLAEWLGVKQNGIELNYMEMQERYTKEPERTAFLLAFWSWSRRIGGYWGKSYKNGRSVFAYKDNLALDELYRELSNLGYRMSTEESMIRNGKCDLFTDEDEEDE